MNTNQPRRPAGTPAGGQWAPTTHAEADIDLSGHSATTVTHGVVKHRIEQIAALFDDLPQDTFKRTSTWIGSSGSYYSPFAGEREVAQAQLRRLVPALGFDLPTRRSLNQLSKKFSARVEWLQAYRDECEDWLAGPDWAQEKITRGIEWATKYIAAYSRAAEQLAQLAQKLPPAARRR